MSGSEWRPLRGLDPRALREARLQAHYAVQWLARAARAYVAPQPDDGHTSMRWQDALDGFATHPFPNDVRLSLRIGDLTLALHDGDKATPMAAGGHSDAQIRHWLGEELAARGLDPAALDAPSPYQIAAHALAGGGNYDAAGAAEGLAGLAAWYANANLSLGKIAQQLAARAPSVSPVCCWPHHFDIATLATLEKRDPVGYVGAGLSPGDDHYDEPYFYVSVYPKPAKLPALPAPGHWHTQDFTAAIAPAHKIVAAAKPQADTDEFLRQAVALALDLLK